MIVTINTDASYSHRHKRGSYAFWIISNQGKIARSGMLKRICHRPEVAEFMCIINAIHALSISGWVNIEKVVINTDCLNVIHLLVGRNFEIRQYRLGFGKQYVAKFKQIVNNSTLKSIPKNIRHIKSHQEIKTPKQWVNDWCDREAKLQINKFLKSLNT